MPEAVWLLVAGPGARRHRLYALAVPAAAGLALLPLALHQRDTVGDPGGLVGLGFAARLAAVPKNFLVGFSIPAEALMVTLAALAAAAGLALAARGILRGGARLVLLVASFAAAGMLLALVLAPFGLDYVSSRNLVAMLVPVAVVLGYGFAQGRTGTAALAALCVVSLVTVVGVDGSDAYQRRDWRGAAGALGPVHGERLLAVSPPFHNPGPFGVYFGARSRLLRDNRPVGELAIVALASGHSFGPGTPAPPRGPTPPPPRGFRLVQDTTTSTYRLVRYRAPRPATVPPAYLRRLAAGGMVLVLQPPVP
jgi:hypothetical protein